MLSAIEVQSSAMSKVVVIVEGKFVECEQQITSGREEGRLP